MSGGAIAALVVGGVVVVGGGVALYVHSRRRYMVPPLTTGRLAYGNMAAKKGPDLTSQLLGSVTSMADAYISSDAGSEKITELLS